MKRLLEEENEADVRMEIVCAVAEIVRADVDQHPDLKNARIRRQKHKYSEELAAPVKPVRDALSEMPPTLVGLFQGMTNMPLYPEITEIGSEDPGRGWA